MKREQGSICLVVLLGWVIGFWITLILGFVCPNTLLVYLIVVAIIILLNFVTKEKKITFFQRVVMTFVTGVVMTYLFATLFEINSKVILWIISIGQPLFEATSFLVVPIFLGAVKDQNKK